MANFLIYPENLQKWQKIAEIVFLQAGCYSRHPPAVHNTEDNSQQLSGSDTVQ